MLPPYALIAALCVGSADETLKLPIVRDAWFSNVGSEADGNNGGASRLKIKSHQEMSLVDFDPAPLRGRTVASAELRVKPAGEAKLLRITVGTFASEWYEGGGSGYEKLDGVSTHNHRRRPTELWAGPGSDLCAVILGNGHTTWSMADAGPVDADGFQAIPIAPRIVAARTAGVSHGLFVFDDTGSEWRRDGEKWTSFPMPNRFFHSKDSNRASAPFLIVRPGPVDREPPGAVGEIRITTEGLPAGEAVAEWTTPADAGPAGTVGFFASIDGTPVPRLEIPMASAGGRVKMRLRDWGTKIGPTSKLSIRAVDGAGNQGPATEVPVRLSTRPAFSIPGSDPESFKPSGPLPRLGSAQVAVIDEFDKVQPVTGETIPARPGPYFAANHLWDAGARTIRLHAAKNEFVAFQVLIRGETGDVRASFAPMGPIRAEVGRYHHVASSKGPLPDPIVAGRSELPPGAKSQSLHVELYVPHGAPAGEAAGTLRLESAAGTLELKVALTVWDFTLPDHLSFLPEMNCYGLPKNERDYYRLAHKHRTFLNRVPYSQRGDVAKGCAPVPTAGGFDWTAWDARFGPLLDGSAFADLPRAGVPIEAFFLPIHENWPTPIEPNYNGSYWADQAFPESYRKSLVDASRAFAEHVNANGWNDTLFEFFLNGKNDFKRNGWSRASSPWILDEPSSFQDFWALRWFGLAFHEGIAAAPGRAKLVYRCDVSRPQWQRDSLDGLLDVNIVGGAFRQYRRLVLDRKRDEGQVVIEYASSNPVEQSNVQPAAWSVDAWSLGSDGVLPWQTVGNAESWRRADPLSLFYPGRGGGEAGPVPSVRLKAYRRGQQDVEYLTLLARSSGALRAEVGDAVRRLLRLSGERRGSGFAGGEDAGLITFSDLKPEDLWRLRTRVGRAVSAARPAPLRRLVEFRAPARNPAAVSRRETKEQPITLSP